MRVRVPQEAGQPPRTDEAGHRWLTAEVVLAALAPGDYVMELSGAVNGSQQKVLTAIRVTR